MDQEAKGAVRALWRNGWVRTAALLAGVIALASVFSTVINGLESARAAVSWAVWIYERVNTPWLGLFVLVIIAGMLWWGIREVRKDMREQHPKLDQQAKENREQLLSDLARAQDRVVARYRSIAELARYAALSDQLGRWTSLHKQAQREVTRLKSDRENLTASNDPAEAPAAAFRYKHLAICMASIYKIIRPDTNDEWDWPDEFDAFDTKPASEYTADRAQAAITKIEQDIGALARKMRRHAEALERMPLQ